jgi:hypothetical protein
MFPFLLENIIENDSFPQISFLLIQQIFDNPQDVLLEAIQLIINTFNILKTKRVKKFGLEYASWFSDEFMKIPEKDDKNLRLSLASSPAGYLWASPLWCDMNFFQLAQSATRYFISFRFISLSFHLHVVVLLTSLHCNILSCGATLKYAS